MYNPETYDWCQTDEEDYNSNDSPEEQAEAERARQDYAAQQIAAMRAAVAEVPSYCERYQRQAKETLLAEYCTGAKQADEYWREYANTGSSKAFGNYCAVNRNLSVLFVDLAGFGMTLEDVQKACAG